MWARTAREMGKRVAAPPLPRIVWRMSWRRLDAREDGQAIGDEK